MLFLAGLMGMVLVGAGVFVGMEPETGDEDENDAAVAGETEAPVRSLGEILQGGDDGDAITGGNNTDQIHGGAGEDSISGGAGGDVLHGGDGDDAMTGNADDDEIHGGYGADTLSGDAGDDLAFGHPDDDLMLGGDGDDTMHGGTGDDTLTGGAGNDALHGYLGDDTLIGEAGEDTLFGGWGDDLVIGLEQQGEDVAQDYLNGGHGADRIMAGPGDIVTAGEGADQVAVAGWGTEDAAAQFLDFDADEDMIVVLYDDSEGDTPPDVALERDSDDDGVMHLLLDGARVMAVSGGAGLTLGDIQLVPESASGLLG